jgi:hypothetical protein
MTYAILCIEVKESNFFYATPFSQVKTIVTG